MCHSYTLLLCTEPSIFMDSTVHAYDTFLLWKELRIFIDSSVHTYVTFLLWKEPSVFMDSTVHVFVTARPFYYVLNRVLLHEQYCTCITAISLYCVLNREPS